MRWEQPPELELDAEDDLELDADDVELPRPTEGSIPPRGKGAKHPARAKGLQTTLVKAFGIVVAVCVVATLVLGGNFLYQRMWNTPERALASLVELTSNGDLLGARQLVAPSAWPITDSAVPAGLARALPHFYGVEEVSWTNRSEAAASVEWHNPTPVPEVAAPLGVWLEKHNGQWKLVRCEGGWDANVLEVMEVVAQLRASAIALEPSRFLSRVVPGGETCMGTACRTIAKALEQGEEHPLIDALRMWRIEPGSLRAVENGDELTLRWLRKTRFLGQMGMIEARFRKIEGKWMVVAVDSEHYQSMNEEMDVWTENHGEMLWRVELSKLVEVKSLTPFCDEWYYGVCIRTVLPTYVKNIGDRSIRGIKVSKVRSLRFMGSASQTLWGVFRSLSPGEGTSVPHSASPPVVRKDAANLSETWEFYRVDWIEFEDGGRLEYKVADYRDALGGTLTFEEVRRTRLQGGLSDRRQQDLQLELEEHGYSQLIDAKAVETPGASNSPALDKWGVDPDTAFLAEEL